MSILALPDATEVREERPAAAFCSVSEAGTGSESGPAKKDSAGIVSQVAFLCAPLCRIKQLRNTALPIRFRLS